jgi:hypothetical protein
MLRGELAEVMLDPPRLEVVMDHGARLAVGIGAIGRAQNGVSLRDGVDRGVQPCRIELTGQPVGHADVEQRTGGVDGLDEPHPALTVGHRLGVGHRRRLCQQTTLSQLVAQQLQTLLVERVGKGVSHVISG